WDGLTTTIASTGASEVWVTHGQEDALVHWSRAKGLKARPLDIVGYGDEDGDDGEAASAEGLPLPVGERDGARGIGPLDQAPPHPDSARKRGTSGLSPAGRGEEESEA